jgi:hypothetical protein
MLILDWYLWGKLLTNMLRYFNILLTFGVGSSAALSSGHVNVVILGIGST